MMGARELETQGWVRRLVVEAGRADECFELYRPLGDEVRVEAVTSDLLAADECATCLLVTGADYVVIYTRSPDV